VCRERDIRTIIALNGRDEAVAAEHERARELGVDHLVFSMSGDGRGDPAEYARVVEIMADPARQPVLVHCAAGAQRTSVAVILYRHLIEGMPIAEAYPESFEYKHRPGQWELPAFLADTLPAIEEAYRGPAPEPQERAEAGTPDDPP
jgi:protein tyrosine/serine phosphatase